MMMTQSYHGSGEYESSYRASQHRSSSTAGYYDRPAPYSAYGSYGYHEPPRQELRPEYGGRPVTRALIHETEPELAPGTARRRIAVACSRCRRRKIKCSGDPGDGTGCQACRASGADVTACTFNRVGTIVPGVEAYPQASSAGAAPHSAGYATDGLPGNGWLGTHHQPQQRPSLPTLHTRSSFLDGYDQYENSPVDSYTYASTAMPRQDSYASSYPGIENYRSWTSSSGPVSAPVSSSYYEQQPSYSFGSLQAPSYSQQGTGRLPSVTTDTFGSLNMSSLHSSLPAHTAQERRLPAPYTITYPPPQAPYSPTQQLPEIRPLGSFSEPRVHINGIHSRNAMPWSSSDTVPSSARTASATSMAPLTGMPSTASAGEHHSQHRQHHHDTTPVSEPAFGYQFPLTQANLPTTDSRDDSSASATGLASLDSFSSTGSSSSSTATMPPPPAASSRYAPSSHHHNQQPPQQHALPILQPEDTHRPSYHGRPTTSSHDTGPPPASLYSFSTDTGSDRPPTSDSNHTASSNGTAAPSASGDVGQTQTGAYAQLCQPQPQHVTSVETLRRQESFEQQQQQRAATGQHRMSVSNLNGRY
ncbi:hypothetical protein B0A50_00847 [Salinomyces thailandicus]|uniref:Zn(2)-C6 fungal-type domain-containing protein n=1 Tax=Salinomyces thailandicus TaxID=706561 RepID=A0A4U0UD58_9PEZI|nr:hypothetical protein B0A50_00847 [Salinomyces thailandica]